MYSTRKRTRSSSRLVERDWPEARAAAADDAPHRRVIIVGAGASGLSCARSLAELAPSVDVVVLEGRSRVGGRISTVMLADGTTSVDLGASYIHGCNNPNNSVYEIALELGVDLRREYGGYQAGWLNECRWYTDPRLYDNVESSRLPQSEVDLAWNLFQEVSASLGKRANQLHVSGKDISIGDFLRQGLPRHIRRQLARLSPLQLRVFQRMVSTVWGYVGPVDELSARLMSDDFTKADHEEKEEEETGRTSGDSWPGNPQQAEENEDALVVPGYAFLIDYLKAGIDVRLEQTVRSVVQTSAGVSVFTRDGRRYDGDAVVVTVPIGVLQGRCPETRIEFVPPLSDEKRTAIQSIGMGCENKVVLRFGRVFWPADGSPYLQSTELGLRFVSMHHYGKRGVLVAHLCPPYSQAIAEVSDDEVVRQVLAVLGGMFGDRMVAEAGLEEQLVTRWGKDPFSMGAYSFISVGATFDHVHALCKREGPVLFAGEATSAFDGQCVTGAYETGHLSAIDVLESVCSFRQCPWCTCYFEAPAAWTFCSRDCRASAEAAQVLCVCGKPEDDQEYLQCSKCERWYHLSCMGLDSAPICDFYCPQCI